MHIPRMISKLLALNSMEFKQHRNWCFSLLQKLPPDTLARIDIRLDFKNDCDWRNISLGQHYKKRHTVFSLVVAKCSRNMSAGCLIFTALTPNAEFHTRKDTYCDNLTTNISRLEEFDTLAQNTEHHSSVPSRRFLWGRVAFEFSWVIPLLCWDPWS